MWTHTNSIDTTATPARVWSLFTDVGGWPAWNAGVAGVELHGPFAVGTPFTMHVPGGKTFDSTLTEVTAHEGFTDETLVGETHVRVSHCLVTLLGMPGGTRITYATEVTGPNAADVGRRVTQNFADVLTALKTLAERTAVKAPPKAARAQAG